MCTYYILTNAIRCTKSNFRLDKREQVGSDQRCYIQYHREFERNIHHNVQFSQRLKINPTIFFTMLCNFFSISSLLY